MHNQNVEVRVMRNAETILGVIQDRPLESCLTSKESRAVRRGAVGKVPVKVTRRPPTLLPVRFGRGRLDSLATKGLAAYLMCAVAKVCLVLSGES